MEADCGDINPEMVKDIAFKLKNDFGRICFVAYGNQNGKAVLNLLLGDELVAEGKDASKIIRQAAKHIKGGGGGQKHFASAGGKEPSGLQNAVSEIRNAVSAK